MSDVTTTDLYEVTMALSYLREGMDGPATFSLFVWSLPPERGFLVSAGAEPPASAPRRTPRTWTPPSSWWTTTAARS